MLANFRPIRLNGGEDGGMVVHNSYDDSPEIQISVFSKRKQIKNIEEYSTLKEALLSKFEFIDHFVIKNYIDKRQRFKDFIQKELVKTNNDFSLLKSSYIYISLLRPFNQYNFIPGTTINSIKEDCGVLFREEPLDMEDVEEYILFPLSKKAKEAFVEEYAQTLLYCQQG